MNRFRELLETKKNSFSLKSTTKSVLFILIIGLIIRLVLAPFTGNEYDITYWASFIGDMESGYLLYGAGSLWYPPIWGYLTAGIGYLLNLLGAVPLDVLLLGIHDTTIIEAGRYAMTVPIFNLAIKLPLIISDLIVGWLIYKFIMDKTNDEKKAKVGLMLWLFCPLTIYMSAIHCQFETLCVLFMIISLLLMFRGSYFFAGVALSISIITKVFPILLLPLICVYILFVKRNDLRYGFKSLLTMIAGFMIVSLFIMLPVIMNGELHEVFNFLTSRVAVPPNVMGDELNISDILKTYSTIVSISIVGIVTLISSYILFRTHEDYNSVFLKMTLVIMVSFFIMPFSNFLPQYYVMLIPLLALITALYKNLISIWAAISLITTVLCLCYINWMYPIGLTGLVDMDSMIMWVKGNHPVIITLSHAMEFIYHFIGIGTFVILWIKLGITSFIKTVCAKQ